MVVENSPFNHQFQVVELDFLYPSEGIHRRWDCGYRITATAATWDQAAFVLSVPRRRPTDETQETLRTSAFPSTHVKVRTSWHWTIEVTRPNIFYTFRLTLCFCHAGQVGKESLYCIRVLWKNRFLSPSELWRDDRVLLILLSRGLGISGAKISFSMIESFGYLLSICRSQRCL